MKPPASRSRLDVVRMTCKHTDLAKHLQRHDDTDRKWRSRREGAAIAWIAAATLFNPPPLSCGLLGSNSDSTSQEKTEKARNNDPENMTKPTTTPSIGDNDRYGMTTGDWAYLRLIEREPEKSLLAGTES